MSTDTVLAYCTQPVGFGGTPQPLEEEWFYLPEEYEPGDTFTSGQCDGCGGTEYELRQDLKVPNDRLVVCLSCGYECIVEALPEHLVVF